MPQGPLRLFVSVRPDPAVASAMAGLLPAGLPPATRPVPASQIHLTLQFIGETAPSRVDEIIESISASLAGLRSQRLVAQDLRVLPERGPGRTIALITTWPGPIAEARRRLAMRLAKRPSKERGESFLPHMTLARLPQGWVPPQRAWPVSIPPFDIVEVELVRSVLAPGGAVHQVVASVPLPPA